MQCPQCQTENPEGAKFCMDCGARLAQVCPGCGTELPAGAKFCLECGAQVGASPAERKERPGVRGLDEAIQRLVPREFAKRLLASGGQMAGERRMVTILMSDVKGSSAMARGMDPEEVMEIMDGAFEVLIEPIAHYEGTVARLEGDAIMAFFGAPIAHEDDAERAIRAALDIVEGANQYAARLERERGIGGFNVRVGIHTGPVVVGEVGTDLRVEYTAMGEAPNLTARLESAAEPGTVLISEGAHRLVAALFETQALEPIEVKGWQQPVPVFRVLAAKEVPGKVRGIAGLESPLVGREAEFAALREALQRLQAGVGGIVTLVGEAGIGKSRLVAEIRSQVLGPTSEVETDLTSDRRPRTSDSGPRTLNWVEGRCLSYGSSIPYLPWLDVLRSALDVTIKESPEAVAKTLARWVEGLCPEGVDAVYPYLARLMSLSLEEKHEEMLDQLDGQQLRERTFAAAEMVVRCSAQREPLVLVLEDLHWADSISMELLERLLALTDRVPLLLWCVFRPRTEHVCWQLRETAARDYRHRHTDLWLEPLSDDEGEALVGHLLEVEGLPEALKGRILSHAEGNPFYVEEIIRSLIDEGAIVQGEATKVWEATRDVAEIPIPDTLHGVLLARIDRLQEEAKRVLQMASVIGRIFLYRILEAIAERERELDKHLITLQRQELIREQARLPELEYIFKHELTREAAYNGLLKKERRAFHRQVGEALERLLPERAEEQVGLLAHHWERAGDAEKAVAYLIRAGDQARLAYAHEEATGYYTGALQMAASLQGGAASQAVMRAYQHRAQVRQNQGRLGEARDDLQLWLEKALEAGDRGAEAEARCNLAQLLWMKYEYDASLAQSEQALTLARTLDDKPLIARSLSSKAMLHFSRGRLPQVAGLLGEALAVFREIGDRGAQAESLWTLGGTRIWEGAYDEGLTIVDESLALCQELRHGLWLNGCFFLKAMALANEGRFGQALAALDEADKSAEVTGVPYWVPRGYNTRGWIHQELGDLRRALELDKKALQTARESGQIEVEANTLVNLATDYRLLQDHEQSGECLRAAEELVKRQDWCSFRCRTRWLWSLGELSLGQGDHEKVLRYAEDMLQLAVSTGQRKNKAKGCKLKGEALAMGGRLDEAMRQLEQALDTAEAIGQANLVWQIGYSLGQVCERQGQPGAAKTHYEQAVRTIEQIGGQIGDETLQRSFTISKPVRAVYDSLARLR